MLWVTFGRARIIGRAFAIGANMKDENCFAQPKRHPGANRASPWGFGREIAGETGKTPAPIELKGARRPF